jgi:LmbE family N-acetylglucosaminyl deacetylase
MRLRRRTADKKCPHMLRLGFEESSGKRCRVLCLGAHSDDIEIGCGGTILELLRRRRALEFCWVVLSSDPDREREARHSADLFLKGAGKRHVKIMDFRDSYFPFEGAQIKESFEKLKGDFSPDLIFTHRGDDHHQDHRLVNQLTWNTWRNHTILEYEIPKYDGDLNAANVYVPFDRKICDLKIEFLMKCFKTQRDKHWFTEDTFQGLMRLRGVEANSPGKYAEAFHCRKMLLAT